MSETTEPESAEPREMPRIVSLLPSATEIVCAIGLGDQLVGRSHECDFPPAVARLPACSRPRIDAAAPSPAIDAEVREIVRSGLSVYEVLEDRLRELAPEVIVTQNQCEVCAVTPADLESAMREWVGGAPSLVSLEPARLEDVWDDVLRVGEATDARDAAALAVADLRSRIDVIARRVEKLDARPRVTTVEWIDPLMSAGNWVPELVELAGGEDVLGAAGKHSPWLESDKLLDADPDVIVVMPCGFDLARTRAEARALATIPGWSALRAVREGRVYVVDGHHFFNRPGPRLVESLEILAEILHPEAFRFGHRGSGWEPMAPG